MSNWFPSWKSLSILQSCFQKSLWYTNRDTRLIEQATHASVRLDETNRKPYHLKVNEEHESTESGLSNAFICYCYLQQWQKSFKLFICSKFLDWGLNFCTTSLYSRQQSTAGVTICSSLASMNKACVSERGESNRRKNARVQCVRDFNSTKCTAIKSNRSCKLFIVFSFTLGKCIQT